jgi:hypothetical protein
MEMGIIDGEGKANAEDREIAGDEAERCNEAAGGARDVGAEHPDIAEGPKHRLHRGVIGPQLLFCKGEQLEAAHENHHKCEEDMEPSGWRSGILNIDRKELENFD